MNMQRLGLFKFPSFEYCRVREDTTDTFKLTHGVSFPRTDCFLVLVFFFTLNELAIIRGHPFVLEQDGQAIYTFAKSRLMSRKKWRAVVASLMLIAGIVAESMQRWLFTLPIHCDLAFSCLRQWPWWRWFQWFACEVHTHTHTHTHTHGSVLNKQNPLFILICVPMFSLTEL